MLKSKILFKISGSIAAYKSAYLISKLTQSNFEVQVVMTDSAQHFIGKATLEGLTGKPVLIDYFENGEMMNHINLVKWADLTILCPASANTINKMANGISDNLVTSLFLAHNWEKPYVIVPAMNTAMYNHPSTQDSLSKLKKWGVDILPTDEGYLACGDIGKGKMLDPEKIYVHIVKIIQSVRKDLIRGNILITSGATREYVDGVRFISNMSTGKTASTLANKFIENNFNVTYLHGINTILPNGPSTNIEYSNFENLNKALEKLISENHFDFIIHTAAVGDYVVESIQSSGQPINQAKLKSGLDELFIKLKPTSKIVDRLKNLSINKNVILIAFKFSAETDYEFSRKEVESLFNHSNADYVVLNNLQDRTPNDTQMNFHLFTRSGLLTRLVDSLQLANALLNLTNR